MPVFLLIRHGETDFVKNGMLAGRLPGVHLNDTGRTQAKALADTLARTPIKSLYSRFLWSAPSRQPNRLQV